MAHPRSGSNSLVEILETQPGLAIVNEPFNENYATWGEGNSDYLGRLRAGESLDELVDEVFSAASGVKELSYRLEGDLLHRLASRPDVRVITLRRRNLLQTALSQLLAEQTGLWKTWDATGPLEDTYRDLEPLDVDLVKERMDWTAHEVARVESAVADLDVLRLVYEEVFAADEAVKREQIDKVWRFLGLPRSCSPVVDHFLSPAVQQARPSTYGRLPNLAEIEALLGSDETGHLEFGGGADGRRDGV